MYNSSVYSYSSIFFFFNDTATTEIYTLSLHDALPISSPPGFRSDAGRKPHPIHARARPCRARPSTTPLDRKSTRLNSSHLGISYAVFCLKKKKKKIQNIKNTYKKHIHLQINTTRNATT